MIFIKELKW